MNTKYSMPKDGGLIGASAPRDIIHRYEKIRTQVYENEYLGVQHVADTIVKMIRRYEETHYTNRIYEETQPFVLGLTTGRTPVGLYRELAERHRRGEVSFANVAVYSLDEFYPIRSTEQQSRNYRIHEEFLNHIDILPENIHIPDGTVPEDRISEYCASYDHAIRKIDLMVLGVGEDGQIGFNEPGSYGRSRTRLVQQHHDVHVAYQTSGNVAVRDDVVLQNIDTAREMGFGSRIDHVRSLIAGKRKGEPEPRELLDLKAAIRRAEARAAVRSFGLDPDTNAHFLDLPFYETGGIKKGQLSDGDIAPIAALLREIRPHQIYAAGDLSDPHGTHRTCMEAVLAAIEVVRGDDWLRDCHMWLYRGAWQEWDLGMVDMAVPLSPDEQLMKRHAIYRHLSQKDIVPFPGSDSREFWQRAEERTQHTARLYDELGMAEYQAIEVFVKMF